MITPIDILDTAVKIGLGAIISGLATYWLAKLNHDKELEKDQIRRRRELLEAVAEQVEKFTRSSLRFWSHLFKPEEFAETDREVLDAFRELVNAESKLLLIGERDCQRLLREYGEYVRDFRANFYNAGQKASLEEHDEFRTNLLSKREVLFDTLSAAYKRYRI